MITKERKYGLIGYPLGHSFSAGYFSKKFDNLGLNATYSNYEIEDLSDLPAIFESGVIGLNVTSPHKENVIAHLDALSPTAKAIGAVNTIVNNNGNLIGYNSDMYGFQTSLLAKMAQANWQGTKALVLGTGGAASAVAWVLRKMQISPVFVSRSGGDMLYNQLTEEIVHSHNLIINATPLGMHPHESRMPEIPMAGLSEKHIVYDLIYNPEKTLFLTESENRGATILNGSEMLILQAEKSWSIWNT